MSQASPGTVPDQDLARARADLSARLASLARLHQIGSSRSADDGFAPELLQAADELLARAGERLRLSSAHTVVALAGGTGSGKSSLFNRLAGAEFSAVGVTRPVTSEVHACVWGVDGSGPLLDWLGVPRRHRYGRSSVLDAGEGSMTGLILLDLPDHDSVVGRDDGQVEQMTELADVMVWVLDPQKYADRAVHRRYLVPLADHYEVIAVVLNQSDLLTAAEGEDCTADLRRLLDAEGLHDVQILVTSAVTGAGLDELRKMLIEAAAARKAAAARISADVHGLVARFGEYAGSPGLEQVPGLDEGDQLPSGRIPPGAADQLAGEFVRAAGVLAICEALRSARTLRAIDFVGWPLGWFADRLTSRDPTRKIRIGKLAAELRGVTAGPSGAQQAEIDNALTELADQVTPGLPKPWSRTVRSAVRSRAEEIPAAVGAAIGEALPAGDGVMPWWRAMGVWQGLLSGGVIVALVWLLAILAFGVLHAGNNVPRLFADVWLMPWIGGGVIVALLLGWLSARISTRSVATAAEREYQRVSEDIERRLAVVADEMVARPASQELAEFDRFRAVLAAATSPDPAGS
jgi:GTP-binding protein EngB required for normal cell division